MHNGAIETSQATPTISGGATKSERAKKRRHVTVEYENSNKTESPSPVSVPVPIPFQTPPFHTTTHQTPHIIFPGAVKIKDEYQTLEQDHNPNNDITRNDITRNDITSTKNSIMFHPPHPYPPVANPISLPPYPYHHLPILTNLQSGKTEMPQIISQLPSTFGSEGSNGFVPTVQPYHHGYPFLPPNNSHLLAPFSSSAASSSSSSSSLSSFSPYFILPSSAAAASSSPSFSSSPSSVILGRNHSSHNSVSFSPSLYYTHPPPSVVPPPSSPPPPPPPPPQFVIKSEPGTSTSNHNNPVTIATHVSTATKPSSRRRHSEQVSIMKANVNLEDAPPVNFNEDPSLSFSPFGPGGLAGGPGMTFGSLAGVDMTTPSFDSDESAPHNFILQPPLDTDGRGVSDIDEKKPSLVSPGRKRGRRRIKEEEENDGWEPPLWKVQLENIKKMREIRNAPVDLMGAHALAEQTTVVTPQVRRYQVLVSLMLSSQTKDQITAIAMTKLKKHGLTIDNIIATPEEEVAKLVHPVGFWRKKGGYIKRVSVILKEKFDYDIPSTMEGLVSLPGVGPKMALLVMDIAWDTTDGIAVDTHVHRISHRLGWMRKATENPEVTRKSLQKWLPQSEWRELNWVLVGFGQQHCLPTTPKCKSCLNEDICPASKLKGGGPWGKKNKGVKKEKKNDLLGVVKEEEVVKEEKNI